MRRAMVSGVVALPMAIVSGCFSNVSPDGALDGGTINVNPDSSFMPPLDAAPVDATYADASIDSAPDSTPDSPPDSALDASDACEGACAGLFATCAELHAATPTATDGVYTLYVGHDASSSWTAYCANLATAPAEYLPLAHTGGGANFSEYTASTQTGGTNVITSYTKVRIDPTTLVVDTSDQMFATSTGSLNHPPSGPTVTSMPYAEAMDCTGPGSLTGVGNVDLRGTPFSVVPNDFTFPPGGVSTVGTATYSAENQVVDLAGGGNCGWENPIGLATPPYNMGGGPILDLVYGLGDGDAGSDAGDGGDAGPDADAAD